jgi:hypothetical protein
MSRHRNVEQSRKVIIRANKSIEKAAKFKYLAMTVGNQN